MLSCVEVSEYMLNYQITNLVIFNDIDDKPNDDVSNQMDRKSLSKYNIDNNYDEEENSNDEKDNKDDEDTKDEEDTKDGETYSYEERSRNKDNDSDAEYHKSNVDDSSKDNISNKNLTSQHERISNFYLIKKLPGIW